MKFIFHLKYNSISRLFLERIDTRFPLSNRLKSMAYDFAMNMFLIIPLIPLSFIENSILYSDYTARFLIPTVFVVGALTKDSKNGRSIGKRLRGFQVVDSKSNKVANSTQCIIRNLTFILWPLEALLILGTPEYRIGDFLARTKVVPHVATDPIEILD